MPRARRRVTDVVGLPCRIEGVDLAAGRERIPGGLRGCVVGGGGVEDNICRHLATVAGAEQVRVRDRRGRRPLKDDLLKLRGAVEDAPVEVIQLAAKGGLAKIRTTVEMPKAVRILLDMDNRREIDLGQGRAPVEKVSVFDGDRRRRVESHVCQARARLVQFWNAPSAPPH